MIAIAQVLLNLQRILLLLLLPQTNTLTEGVCQHRTLPQPTHVRSDLFLTLPEEAGHTKVVVLQTKQIACSNICSE